MLTIDEVRSAIETEHARWEAEENEIFIVASADDRDASGLFGLNIEDDTGRLRAASENLFEALTAAEPPRRVDWRERGRVTPVKNQRKCGACVAFATCATMESSVWIRTGNSVVLSEGHLFHCHGGSCATGWGLTHGLDAAQNGVGLDSLLPWSTDGVCKHIPAATHVLQYRVHADDPSRRRAVASGPVLAGMDVYQDFTAYRTGVYKHVTGSRRGRHAVCIVGYDMDDGCWIVKNSWGPDWGEGGFFRIAFGQCNLDTAYPFYSVVTGP